MSDEEVRVVLAEGFMARRHDWQGTRGPGFSLQEPDWPQEKLALSLGATALAALAADNYAVVKLPEGVAVEHGARLVCWSQRPMAQQLYAIEPPEATP